MSSKMSTPGAESKPGGSKKKDPLAKKKDELYTRCLERFSSDVFNQTDLVGLGVTKDLQELMLLCQGLASANMFQILTLDGTVCYKIRQKDDANKSVCRRLLATITLIQLEDSPTWKPKISLSTVKSNPLASQACGRRH